jgi:hypothetical protein
LGNTQPIWILHSFYLDELACIHGTPIHLQPWNRKEMKTFMISCGDLDTEAFLVEAETKEKANEIALRELGWYAVELFEDDDEDEDS